MRRFALPAVVAFFMLNGAADAATITFDTDPFAGSTALITPGRQVVGGEPFIAFMPGADVFSFSLAAFGPYGVGPSINFVNDVVGNLPTTGVNAIALRTFDDDANPATAFGAGNAANLIAAQLTAPRAGFFIYFNSALDVARLVFSTNLDDNTADLKILARLTNLAGAGGQIAMGQFTAANFATASVPEPSSLLLMATAGAAWALRRRRR
jgi:hypothetical protein